MISHSTVVEARDLAREVGQRCRERRLLVEAGDLDDELHARAGRGDGAYREVDAVHSLAPSIPHGERDDHPAGPGPGPCCRPPQPAPVVADARARRPRAGHRDRVPGLPDLSRTTTATTRCCGAASCCTGSSRPSTATARRPSIRSPSPSGWCSRSSAIRPTGSWSAPRWRRSSCSPPASTAWRRRRSGRSSGLAAAALLCTRFDFPFLAARAYIDIPYLAFVVWAAALEAERPRRGTVVFVLLACAGLMRPEAWLLSGLYWLWCFRRPPRWPQRIRYSVLTGAAAGDLDGARLVGDRRSEVLADPHQRPGRGARAHQRRPVRRSQHDGEVPEEPRQGPGLLRGDPRRRHRRAPHAAARAHAAGAAGHRPGHLRARRPGRAVGHRPLPARALAAGHGLRGRRARAAGRCCAPGARGRSGPSGRSRSSSTAWPSRPPGSTSRPSPTS